jgi:PAS domain S-box-containing protein
MMPSAAPLRLLIVDDNPAIHDDFRKILTSAPPRKRELDALEAALFGQPEAARGPTTDFQIDTAYQGREALERVEHALALGRPYALAFVDVRMPPGWDGVETIEQLWKADPALQVVICTAYSDYSWEKMSARLGLNDNLVILKKPFDNLEVLQLAHALTRKWELTQQAQLRVEQLDDLVRQRTAELRRSEERFATAFRASPVALAIQRLEDDRFVDANEAFAALTGHDRAALLGHTPFELCLALDYADAPQHPPREAAARLTTRSGELREVLVSSARLALGGEPHLLLMLQDISHRLRLESHLRQAQKMEAVGQLAAGVAHDFNNLLTIIEGHASLQLASEGLSADVQESLQQIEQAAERAADLTRQLLAFSRRQIMRPRVLGLNAVLTDLLGMLRRVLGERIELRWQPDEALPPICADQTSLEQIVMNLVLNARDAMPGGGTITLATSRVVLAETNGSHPPEARPGDFACLSVADTGLGMDEATRARIFEPFFTTKEVNKGTGMGLATVYGLARQHEGWVEVTSAPGCGATFRVLLPVTDQAPERPPAALPPPPKVRRAHTIFVVEDDEAVRALVREILEHHGYRVLEAASGDAALALWPRLRSQVELLLTDMVMPGEHNGLELARKLQADQPALKVIYTSGYSTELFASDLELLEGRNYLPKPYLTAKLLAILHRALDGEEVPA